MPVWKLISTLLIIKTLLLLAGNPVNKLVTLILKTNLNGYLLKGAAFYKLWEYEVVEAFFATKVDGVWRYLEVEFSPHGHHLVLLLNGVRNAIKHSLPIQYEAKIGESEQGRYGAPAISSLIISL